MKTSTIKFGLILLSLGLAGCSTAGGGGAGANAPAAPATGTVVAQGDMPEFCQNAAAAKYGASLEDVSTIAPVARSFGLLIQGSVDTDTNTFGFDCRFSPSGAFLGLITQ